jgi:MYXO-CTERM domain-containing protein
VDDPDEIFVFLQISDTHVGEDAGFGTQDTDALAWTIGQAADVILPEFVVITGDLVDATNGGWIPSVQYQSEWDEYRDVLDTYGMDVTFLHDLCGNHDTYSDEGASYYLANSLIGEATGEWNETWVHTFPFGDYLFVGLNSAETLGAAPLFDDPGLTPAELTFLEDALVQHADASLAFVFTHHPEHELLQGADEFLGLLEDHRASVWGYGHTHQYGSAFRGQTLQLNVASAGKSNERNLGLYAVDHDGVSARATTLGDWPQVLITAPVDASLGGGNPHAYPASANHHANPVRALVFDVSSPNSVVFSVDGGPDQPMVEVAPSVWQGEWDASSLPHGAHEIAVVATTPSGTDTHAIRVETAITECDDGADNDGNGFTDYPDDGGCFSPSDDAEAGWIPGDDDDDDSSGDDDDDSQPVDDDDVAVGDDDPGRGCGCVHSGPRARMSLVLLVAVALASRRRRTTSLLAP